MIKRDNYAIGQQDFKVLRMDGAVYVDKTQYVAQIVSSSTKYFFLARPRRFGKSLFLSTLKYFFRGERNLFKGLAVDSMDWDWEPHPVLHLDLNSERYSDKEGLAEVLDSLFQQWEKEFGVLEVVESLSVRLRNIIEAAHSKTGRRVVVLVDEYDKPLVGNLNDSPNFEHYRTLLASVYSNFKSAAEHLRLVFLTGVSRFSKLSVFSDLNNLKDISFTNEYADICGITEAELQKYFQEGIGLLAERYELDREGACRLLKKHYDGYRFGAGGNEIYNPWSLLNAMQDSSIENYWNATGMPTIVAESLKRINADLEKSLDIRCRLDDLQGLDLLNPNPTALLYQTGYLTIKQYNQRLNYFRLGIPNKEVKRGLYSILLPYYVKLRRGNTNDLLLEVVDSFDTGHPEEAMKGLQAFFAGIDYKMRIDDENNFHNALYLLTHILGLDVETEMHTSDGSIDLKIENDAFIYIIELKYNRPAAAAMKQIEEKCYARPWQRDSRQTILIGASFSSKTRCIEDWEIKPLNRE